MALKLLVQQINPDNSQRIKWIASSLIKKDDKLLKNVELIIENVIDPLAAYLEIPKPSFSISFEKSPFYSFREVDQTVGDTSAGSAIMICMISSMLNISIRDDIALTGSITPPHSKINWVKETDRKIEATHKVDEIKKILIPVPDPEEEINLNKIDEAKRAKLIFFVKSIEDIYEQCFDEVDLFNSLMNNPIIFKIYKEKYIISSEVVASLFKKFSSIYKDKWYTLRKILLLHQEDDVSYTCFNSLINFYLINSEDPSDIITSYTDFLMNYPIFRDFHFLRLSHCIDLKKLYNSSNYKDWFELLEIIHNCVTLTNITKDIIKEFDYNYWDEIEDVLVETILANKYYDLSLLIQSLMRDANIEDALPLFRPMLLDAINQSIYEHGVKAIEDLAKPIKSANNRTTENESKWGDFISNFDHLTIPLIVRNCDNIRAVKIFFLVDPILVIHIASSPAVRSIKNIIDLISEQLNERKLKDKVYPQYSHLCNTDIELAVSIGQSLRSFKKSEGIIVCDPKHIDLNIKVEKDLKKVEYKINKPLDSFHKPFLKEFKPKGNNFIKNPISLFPNSTDIYDFLRADNWDPNKDEIKSLPDGLFISEKNKQSLRPIDYLNKHGNMRVVFDNIEIYWQNIRPWELDIGQLYFLKILRENGYFEKKIKSVAEVISGSGILGIYLAKNNKYVKSYNACDASVPTKSIAKYNIEKNLQNKIDKGFSYSIVSGSKLRSTTKKVPFDLVIAYSYFLPEIEDHDLYPLFRTPKGAPNPIEEIIKTGEKFAKEILIGISELAKPELENACTANKASFDILASIKIPFIISNDLLSPIVIGLKGDSENSDLKEDLYIKAESYIGNLVKNKNRNLMVENKRNFKYWHNVLICTISYNYEDEIDAAFKKIADELGASITIKDI